MTKPLSPYATLIDLIRVVIADPFNPTRSVRRTEWEAKNLLRILFQTIATEVLERNHTVSVPHFGVFYKKTSRAKSVKLSGKQYDLPPQIAVGFRPSKYAKRKASR